MNIKNKIGIYWNLAVFAVFTLMVAALPELASADADTLQDILCKGNEIAQSNAGKALAIAAIIILGLAALLGKISWGLGLMVILGIALIFGAEDLVDAIAEDSEGDCMIQ